MCTSAFSRLICLRPRFFVMTPVLLHYDHVFHSVFDFLQYFGKLKFCSFSFCLYMRLFFFSPLFSLFTNRSVTYSYFSLLFYFALSFSLSFSNNSSSFVILAIYLRWLSAPDKGFFFNRTIWNYLQSIITNCKVLINNKIIKSSVYLTAFKSAHVSGPTQWFMTT